MPCHIGDGIAFIQKCKIVYIVLLYILYNDDEDLDPLAMLERMV